jgi:hypothetical protein
MKWARDRRIIRCKTENTTLHLPQTFRRVVEGEFLMSRVHQNALSSYMLRRARRSRPTTAFALQLMIAPSALPQTYKQRLAAIITIYLP